MKTFAAFILISLLAVDVWGQARDPRVRCLCADGGLNMLRLNRFEKIEILPPSHSCEKYEIIATLKDGAGKKCLRSISFHRIIKKRMEKRLQQ